MPDLLSSAAGDLREIVAKHINQAALDERNDVATLNASLQTVLERKGLIFNKGDPASFVAQLKTAGFYTEWKASTATRPGAFWSRPPAS